MIVEPGGAGGEQGVEHPAHGEDRRSAIDAAAADLNLAHLAARPRTAFDHRDDAALGGEDDGRTQAADAGADDDDAVACQFRISQ